MFNPYHKSALPDRITAVKMANAYLQERIHNGSNPQIIFEHGVHVFNVAKIAEAIAAKSRKLDPDTAYVLGLLHDIGRVKDETVSKVPHTIEGFYHLHRLGYPKAARICITHSFINKNFQDTDFPTYDTKSLNIVRGLLKNMRYTDYDRLIQLADLFSRGKEILSIRQRLDKNKRFYKVAHLSYEEDAFALRDYFNKKYHLDVEQIVADTFSMYKSVAENDNRNVIILKNPEPAYNTDLLVVNGSEQRM